ALVGQDDHKIHVCETATGKVLQRLGKEITADPRNLEGAIVFNLAFSSDGKYLATSAEGLYPEFAIEFAVDPLIHIWDLSSGKERLQVETERPNSPAGNYLTQGRVNFAWSPDGRTLAVGQYKIRLWELATLGVRRELPGHPDAPIRALTFAPDGRV